MDKELQSGPRGGEGESPEAGKVESGAEGAAYRRDPRLRKVLMTSGGLLLGAWLLVQLLDVRTSLAAVSLAFGVAAFGLGTVWLHLLMREDRYQPEPVRVVAAVGFFGGIISAFLAAKLNGAALGVLTDLLQRPKEEFGLLGNALFYGHVGLNEELWKLVATAVIISRLKEYDEPVDALVYAGAVGLGFAVVENIGYAIAFELGRGEGFQVLLRRNLISVPMHMGCAVIWGLGLARARFGGVPWQRAVLPLFLLSAFAHGLFDLALTVLDSGYHFYITFGSAGLMVAFGQSRLKQLAREGHLARLRTANRTWARFFRRR